MCMRWQLVTSWTKPDERLMTSRRVVSGKTLNNTWRRVHFTDRIITSVAARDVSSDVERTVAAVVDCFSVWDTDCSAPLQWQAVNCWLMSAVLTAGELLQQLPVMPLFLLLLLLLLDNTEKWFVTQRRNRCALQTTLNWIHSSFPCCSQSFNYNHFSNPFILGPIVLLC